MSTRREFLSTSAAQLGGGWLLLHLPVLSTLAACARDAAERGDPFSSLTPEQGRTAAAFAARVIPSEPGSPGATEAGAAYFVDAAIAGPLVGLARPVQGGLAELDQRAADTYGAAFADLEEAQQDEVIRAFQEGELFFPLRMVTVMGVFSDPSYGGNRDGVGWKLLRMEHAQAFQPPFGHYDAEAAGGAV